MMYTTIGYRMLASPQRPSWAVVNTSFNLLLADFTYKAEAESYVARDGRDNVRIMRVIQPVEAIIDVVEYRK
jgi:hypothetical protein